MRDQLNSGLEGAPGRKRFRVPFDQGLKEYPTFGLKGEAGTRAGFFIAGALVSASVMSLVFAPVGVRFGLACIALGGVIGALFMLRELWTIILGYLVLFVGADWLGSSAFYRDNPFRGQNWQPFLIVATVSLLVYSARFPFISYRLKRPDHV